MKGNPDNPSRAPVDEIDALLAINRILILEMISSGRLDRESGMALYESTTRPDVVAADRAAFDKDEFGPNSPMGRLGLLFFKLKPGANS